MKKPEMARAVIIDTNFWLLPFEKRINILGQLERMAEYAPLHIIVPVPVHNELKAMAGRRTKKRIAAKSALAVIERLVGEKKAQLYEINGSADGAIITSALQTKGWVATNDRQLRMRLGQKKIRTIVLRDEHTLGFF